MPYIKTLNYEDATGKIREIYDDLVQKRGKLAEVHKLQSLHPETIPQHMDFYMELMFGKSPLKRAQREMIAVVVSGCNQCEYCIKHHGSALRHFWKDENKVERLARDFRQVNLPEADQWLCTYAEALTLHPHDIDETKHILPLRQVGWDDQAILDTAMIASYFNFVNRMVMGLGVPLESDKGEGYYYE